MQHIRRVHCTTKQSKVATVCALSPYDPKRGTVGVAHGNGTDLVHGVSCDRGETEKP